MKATDQGHGEAVDAYGGQVVDPTANVLALVAAESKRQDDILRLTSQLQDEKARCLKEVADLREDHAKALASAETSRLNAIRQVDVLAVSTAAERANTAIDALAKMTATNAETLRALVSSTATTIAAQTQQTVTTITERLAALEKSSYEGKGKETVSDPILAELTASVKVLSAAKSEGAGGKDTGRYVINLVGLLVGLAIAAITLFLKH